jgi:hypothetical protein
MDVIFQSGEFINDSSSFIQFLIELTGAFIGAGAALFLFYKKTKYDENKEKKQKETEARDNVFFFKNLLKYSIEEQKRQNKEIKNYIEDVKKSPSDQLEPIKAFPLSNLDRLAKELNDSTFFHSYMRIVNEDEENSKIESYRKISAGIDYLNKGNKQIYEAIEIASVNDLNRRNRYQEISDKVIKSLRQFVENNNGLFIHIQTFLDDYLDSEQPKNSDEHVIRIVQPLLEEVDPFTDEIPAMKGIQDGLKTLIRLDLEIKSRNNEFLKKLDAGLKDLNKTVDILQESENQFKKLKPKSS